LISFGGEAIITSNHRNTNKSETRAPLKVQTTDQVWCWIRKLSLVPATVSGGSSGQSSHTTTMSKTNELIVFE
jgi:hypothetical protein